MALGAVGAGVTAGLTEMSGLTSALSSSLGSETAVQVALGGMRSIATQGIGVMTGLQSSFDWKGVAASAIAGGVAYQVGDLPWKEGFSRAEYITRGLAAGVTSALVRGQSIGKNLGAITADVVGATIGNQIGAGLAGMSAGQSVRQAALPSIHLASSGGEGGQAAIHEAWRMALEQTGTEIRFLGEQPHLGVDVYGSTLLEQLSEQAGGAALGLSQSAVDSLNATRRVGERPVAEMRAIEPSTWEKVWGNAGVQHAMNHTMTGKLVGGLVRTAGNAWASVSESRYDFAKLKILTLVEQRDARIDTLLNAALLPVGAGVTVGVKAEMFAARGAILEGRANTAVFGVTPVAVKEIPLLRQQYIDAVEGLAGKAVDMRVAGFPAEQIARTLHADRRALGVYFKDLTSEVKRIEIYERNIAKYGDELGPSIDWLRKQDKSWEQIIESATRSGGKDLEF